MTRLTVAPDVDAIDLEPVKAVLAGRSIRWTEAQCELVERWYRRYLTLALLYPSAPLVPTPEIDEFWHRHILFTQKYSRDCDRVLGRFLHHHPSLPGEFDSGDNGEAEWTRQRLSDFGEPVDDLNRQFWRAGRGLASLLRD